LVGQVWNTGGAIFSTGGANAPPVKQVKKFLQQLQANSAINITPKMLWTDYAPISLPTHSCEGGKVSKWPRQKCLR